MLVVCALAPLMMMAQSTTVRREMERIEQTRGVNFVYDSSLKTDVPYRGRRLDRLTLRQALDQLFSGTGIGYKLKGRYVLLHAIKTEKTKATKSTQQPRRHTLSGRVSDSHGESLINATVYDLTTRQGTMTNAYGFFSLTLPEGQHELRFSYLGFDDQTMTVSLDSDIRRDVSLKEDATLDEVVVVSDMNSPLVNTQTGKRSLGRDDIKTEYSLLSSPDVVKTLQRTSGVAEGVELASGLYVHGGNNDENLYLIDGSPLYSINHTLGLFSAFNADVVKNVDFYKSGFPARYGGRLSSVVDVRTADGDFHNYHGSYRLGLLDGSVQVEGPIRRGKTSFNFGLRRSWLDLITRPLFAWRNHTNDKDDDDLTLSYFFHDLNAKVTNIFSPRSRLSLSLYSGQDRLKTKDKWTDHYGDGQYYDSDVSRSNYSWGNLNVALDWQLQLSPRLFATATAVYTHNRSRLHNSENETSVEDGKQTMVNSNSHTYRSTIDDLGYRLAFDFRPSPRHHLRFGTDYTWHTFHPQTKDDRTLYQADSQVDTTVVASANNLTAHEWTAYAEDEMALSDRWSVNCGLNLSLLHVPGKTFAATDPRLAIRWQASPRVSLKASLTMMTQYVHKISNSVLELPSDYWVPTTRRLSPMKSAQVAGGVYVQPDGHWLFSVEGYYKRSTHLLQYSSWTGLEPPAGSWDNAVMDGRGCFYGVEADACYKTSRLRVEGSYTLSWNKRRYPDFYPKWYYDKFDNRHKFNLSARWRLSSKVSMMCAWTFHSGNHISVPTQYVRMPESLPDNMPTDETVNGMVRRDGIGSWWLDFDAYDHWETFIYERPNNLSLPAYHRLDLGFDFHHTTRHGHERVWNVSLYNAYCHLNSLYVDYSFTHEGRFRIKNRAYVPIVPSCSYTIKF